MLDLKPSPVRVSSQAAHKLPRFLLLAVLVVFALSGLFGRDLWSSEEARSLGEVLGMISSDTVSWLFPWASGEVIVSHGPLVIWVGALFAKLTANSISPLFGMRLSALLWFAITTASIWYGTWFLARRKEAQPVALVFGREAPYRDYGRLVADSATLFVVSLFGLVVILHEPTITTAELALSSLAYFGCAWALTRPYWASALSGFACGLLMLASSLLVGLTVLTGCLVSHIFVHGIGRLNRKLLTTFFVALLTLSLWPATAYFVANEVAGDYFNLWAQAQLKAFGVINLNDAVWFVKHLAWYLCPAWPFAVLAVWRWRKDLSVTQIAMPLSFFIVCLLGVFISNNIDAETLVPIVITPICTLAAFGLMSSRRNGKSMLECFCVAVFSLALAGMWIYWLAFTIQWPPKMHYSVLRLVADESAGQSDWLGIIVALFVLIFWLTLCVQRIKQHPTVFWNGPWLSASGMTVLWITALALFQPAIDSNRTYRYIASEMHSSLTHQGYVPNVDCVRTFGLNLAERTAISWHSGDILTVNPSEACRFYISRQSKGEVHPQVTELDGVELEAFRPRSNVRYRVGKMAPVIEK